MSIFLNDGNRSKDGLILVLRAVSRATNPELRAEYFFAGFGAQAIKKLFDELRVDEHGLCSNCSAVFHTLSK